MQDIIDFLKSVHPVYLDSKHFIYFYILSIVILIGYIMQGYRHKEMLGNKIYNKELYNIDLIYSKIKLFINKPNDFIIRAFPSMITLSITMLVVTIAFKGIGTLILFYIMAAVLIIQDFIHYKFLYSKAVYIEENNADIIKELHRDEWYVNRQKIKSSKDKNKLIQGLQKTDLKKAKQILPMLPEHSFIDTYMNTEAVYDVFFKRGRYTLYKIEPVLSPMIASYYKLYNWSKEYTMFFFEGVVVITTLYLSLVLDFN